MTPHVLKAWRSRVLTATAPSVVQSMLAVAFETFGTLSAKHSGTQERLFRHPEVAA